MSGFFGNTNNNSTGFGGFGTSNNSTGFGANNNASTGGSIFGGGNTAAPTSGGFGSTSGFGSTNTGFGAKPAGGFGAPASTGTGLFGSAGNTNTTASTGFGAGGGGFGASNTGSGGFGASNTSGGLFGAKPASTGFGSTANTGSTMFGGGAASNTSAFGSNAATSNPFASNTSNTGFGASNTTTNTTTGFGGGFGASAPATSNNGTGGTPFQAFTEKDGASSQTSHYQSITFQQPYQNKSFEELRVEDYMQGRKFGNTNGQAGSFGQTTGFGGSVFGNNNTSAAPSGGLFGANNTTTNSTTAGFGGFGANNNAASTTTSGFGSTSAGGGLFGANKPAGGLFGASATTAAPTGGFGSTAGSTGGLFGGGNTGVFGANNNTANTGGNLFGGGAAQKPAGFGGFGTSQPAAGGFGNTTNNNTGSGLFGASTNNAASTSGGLFGANNNNQQQQPSNPFGGASTANNNSGGLFGAQKPGGLFGSSTNTGNTGGLFGAANNNNQQPAQQSGGLFGGSNTNTNTGSGLFGGANNIAKPAGGLFGSGTTGSTGGLFGGANNNQQQTSSGGLFGSNNNAGSSLFGGNNQNKPATGSLFGNTSNTGNTGGLFGNNNSQQNQQNNSGGSLFGGLGQSNNNQAQSNSMFGSSLGQSNNPNQQNQLHANLTVSPYGNDQLFSSLTASSTPVGPLATPLAGARPTPSKTPSLLSSTRLNSPVYTPRASTLGRNPGYGFSYSTYGTPGSAYSVSLTPQASSLLRPTGSLGSALTSRLSKSMSMNSLRGGEASPRGEGESLLRPTPGSASSRYLNSGSMRKLNIDRSMKHEAFKPRQEPRQVEATREIEGHALRKQVSFDGPAEKTMQSNAEPSPANALVRTEESEGEESPQNLFRAAPTPKPKTNGAPEMHQVNGNSSLTTVFENGDQRPSSAPSTNVPAEKIPSRAINIGNYSTSPSIKDLKNMSRTQLSKLDGLTVRRDGVGRIEFGPCDLTNTNLDEICGSDDGKGIVHLKLRTATVYPDEATKPPRGKGLNVPSTIYLENSWPKSHGGRKAVLAKSGSAYEKHLRRLKQTGGTKFLNYDADTGIWSFTVQHFTTYGLDDDDDEDSTEDMDMQESSELSDAPETPGRAEDDTMQSIETGNGSGDVDDTFEFKLNKRSVSSVQSARGVPGGFDESHISYDYDDSSADEGLDGDHLMSGGLANEEQDPFLSPNGGAVQAPSRGEYDRYHSSMVLDVNDGTIAVAEEQQESPEPEFPGSFAAEEPRLLRSILKPTSGHAALTSPQKLATENWEDQLQRTMSPKKRDRQYLRELQQSARVKAPAEDLVESPFKRSMLGQSALGQSYLAQKSAKKVDFGGSVMFAEPTDFGKSQAFHTSMDIMNSLWSQEKSGKKTAPAARGFERPYSKKPRLSASGDLDENDAIFHGSMKPSFANDGTIVISVDGSTRPISDPLETALQPLVSEHKEVRFAKWVAATDINTPALTKQKDLTDVDIVNGFPHANTSAAINFTDMADCATSNHEIAIWRVAGGLLDRVETAYPELMDKLTEQQIAHYEPRLRKDGFSKTWSELVQSSVEEQLGLVKSAEERALLYLTTNDVPAACDALVAGKDFKLATLVSQLPSDHASRGLMQNQIAAWCERNDWSEFPEATRALYSILAGHVCTIPGKVGPAENRVKEVCIAEQFGLTWQQSFGLRLFFGGHSTISEAIRAYCSDLADQKETVLPVPGWAAQGQDAGREDALMGLLRLSIKRADLEALFDPKSVSGSAVNSRLAWQMATQLRSQGYCSNLSDDKLDQLTTSYAAELEVAGSYVTATWVLLHLRSADTRFRAVTDILQRNGGRIPDPATTDPDYFDVLSVENKVPAELLWSAKALHARAELNNPWLQTQYLLNAHSLDEAHDVICATLGPKAIIEKDYKPLLDLLTRFPIQKPEGWVQGGAVFSDFARLMGFNNSRKFSREGQALAEKLRVGLAAMEGVERNMGLEERVAMVEMGTVLRDEMRQMAIHGSASESEDVEMGDVRVGGTGSAFLRYREALGVVV